MILADFLRPLRNPTSIRLALGLACALIPSPLVNAADSSPARVPEEFRAHIGGFLGGDYVVEMRGSVITYTARAKERGQPARTESVTPTTAQWREFRAALDELKIWQWKADYPSKGMTDGTQWSLDIAYADRSLKAQGRNQYPGDDAKASGQPVPGKTFQRYLAAVKNLHGGRDFE